MDQLNLPSMSSPLLIVISGTSGSGKDSIIKEILRREYPFFEEQPNTSEPDSNNILKKKKPFHFVVTTTSREPREEEVPDIDYFFMTEEEFELGITEGKFLEHAIVYDQYKGVAKKQVQEALDSGKDVIMRLNVEGAATIKAKHQDAILFFITTENQENLMNRLSLRNTDTAAQLEKRMKVAQEELALVSTFDYTVVNYDNKLNETVDNVLEKIKQEHIEGNRKRITL